jgi:transcription elongation factor Elf1
MRNQPHLDWEPEAPRAWLEPGDAILKCPDPSCASTYIVHTTLADFANSHFFRCEECGIEFQLTIERIQQHSCFMWKYVK